MKLHSHEKLPDVVLRVKVNEKLAGLLEQYVAYANTHLGHHFADVKELSAEVLRSFVEEDRGFKAWCKGGGTNPEPVTVAPGLPDEQRRGQREVEQGEGRK